jgi:hypothetical protein
MRAEYVPTADQRALVESAAAFGITQADIAEHEPVVGGRDKLDPACLAAKLVNLDKGQTEARDPKKRGAPVGDRAKLSTNQRSACCT